MKIKKIKMVILAIFYGMGMIGCNEHTTDNELANISEIKQNILFINYYSNAAYDYIFKGAYIDIQGNVYAFDLSDSEYRESTSNISLPDYLAAMDGNELIGTIDKDELLKYYNMLLKVNENAKKKAKPGACDMGTQVWECVLGNEDETMRTVLIYSTGDDESYSTDKYAKKIAKWLNDYPINLLNSETN